MKLQRLNCERARNISIVQILAKLGHFPSRKSEKEAWFLSPLRSETQASFKVSLKRNRWYDFGIGKGGNSIDLVCLLSNCSVGEALQFLSDEIPVFCIQGPINDTSKTESGNTILKVKPITKSYLKKYVSSRGISLEIASSYCKEVWYECRGKSYYAIGLQNKDDGWELRSLYYKTSSSPKSYTYFQNGNDKLVICEGMFDLLSIAEIYPEELNDSDIIVLNSLSFLQQITPYFKNYISIDLYLDNDPAGKKNAKELLQYYPNIKDQSHRYKNYKDLNEKLAGGRILSNS